MANERELLLKEAKATPLIELAKQVIYGSYTPGVHDVVLIERLEEKTIKYLPNDAMSMTRCKKCGAETSYHRAGLGCGCHISNLVYGYFLCDKFYSCKGE